MSIFKDKASNIVKEVGNTGDKLFSSKEEMGEITNDSHSKDMMSDSWLSKNIRPLVFLLTIAAFIGMLVANGFGVVFAIEMFQLVGKLLSLMIGFYYGGRSIEKGIDKIAKRWRKNEDRK